MSRWHARTDVGRKRTQNEDALLVEESMGLFVVADGVGGRKAGELASALTVDTFQNYGSTLQEAVKKHAEDPGLPLRNQVLQLLQEAADAASQRVYELADKTGREGMTTTLAAAIVGGGFAFLVHVGDSRIYLLRDGRLRLLTEDHSLVNEMLRAGSMTREEARKSRYRNVITRAIGLYPNVHADTLALELMPGDRLLLCSDGLSDLVAPKDLTTMLRQTDITDAVEQLVDAALEAGGKDNITVIGLEPPSARDADTIIQRAEILENLFLFADLPDQARIRVGRIVSDRHVQEGEIVVSEQDPGRTMYVVLRGSFDVLVGRRKVASLVQGEHFGEMCLVDDAPRSATIVARTEGDLLAIDRDALRSYCAMEPEIGNRILWRLLATTAQRLRDTNARLAGSKTLPPE